MGQVDNMFVFLLHSQEMISINENNVCTRLMLQNTSLFIFHGDANCISRYICFTIHIHVII